MGISRRSLAIYGLMLAAAPSYGQDPQEPCALITTEEIQAVQGQPVTQTKSSRPTRAAFAVTQCFYTVEPFEKSVSLELTRPLVPAGAQPREDWNRLFHASKTENTRSPGASSKPPAKKKNAGTPRRVNGIGEEAFWIGDQVVGVLYVLTGDAYFRLSVGGWTDGDQRRRKSTELARSIVKRLASASAHASR